MALSHMQLICLARRVGVSFIIYCVALGGLLSAPPSAEAQRHGIYGEAQQQYLRDYDKRRSAQARSMKSRSQQRGGVSQSVRGPQSRFQPQAPREGDPIASLVLIGPAPTIYSRFGHVAIRVQSAQRDDVYELGVGRPGLSGVEAQLWGRAEFVGERHPLQQALNRWRDADRDVTIYPLRLGPADVTTLYHELEARVDGRSPPYHYDPFRENCSTQVRQVLDSITHGLISRVGKRTPSTYTFRDEVNHGYAKLSTLLTLTQLWGGLSLDQSRTMWEMSALPVHLVKLLERLSAQGTPLLESGRALYRRRGGSVTGGWSRHSAIVITLGLGLLLLGPMIGRTRSPGLEGHPAYHRLFWSAFRVSIASLGGVAIIALLLTLNSKWLDLRNSWALYLNTPLDVVLLGTTASSSLSWISFAKRYVIMRSVLTFAITVIICSFVEATPPNSLLIFTISALLTCFWSLGLLESKAQREHYERSLELKEVDELSWGASKHVDHRIKLP